MSNLEIRVKILEKKLFGAGGDPFIIAILTPELSAPPDEEKGVSMINPQVFRQPEEAFPNFLTRLASLGCQVMELHLTTNPRRRTP